MSEIEEFPEDESPEEAKPAKTPPPKHDWGFDIYLARTSDQEGKYIKTVADFREALEASLMRRETLITYQLPVMAWMAMLDEIQDRRPRNFSQLLRDDHLRQLHGAIERLHEEINFVIAYGPSGSVASRMDPERVPSRRDLASPELRRILRDKGGEN